MSFLDFLDIVSYKPKLHIFQKLRYSCIIGKIIGLLTLTTILTICIYFTILMFEKKEMIIIYNESSLINRVVNLTSTPFIFTLIDGNSSPIDKSLYEIRVNLWNWSAHDNQSRSFDILEFPLELCNEEKHFGQNKKLFKSIDVNSSYCLPSDKYNVILYGKYSLRENDYSFINIAINMCNNITTNGNCKSKEIIASSLKNSFLSLIYADYEVDHEDISTPLRLKLTGEIFPLNWDIHNRYFYSFKNIIHNTDDGFILEAKKTREGYFQSVNTYTAQIRHGSFLYPGLTFATITMIKEQKTSIYLRNYMKLQNLLAKLGGIVNLILMIGKLIVYNITRNLLLREVLNMNFILDQSSIEITNTNNSVKAFQKREIINLEVPALDSNSKQLEMNIIDVICPYYLRKKSKASNTLNKINDILSKFISVDNILKCKIQLEILKDILLDPIQKIQILGKSKININYFDNVENKKSLEDVKNKIKIEVKKKINKSNLINLK